MRQLMALILCAWVGFWFGANHLVPLWLIVVLAVLGAGCWGAAEWLEHQERRRNGDNKP
jgi:fatty acid desaturase